MTTTTATRLPADFADELRAIIGEEHVLTDDQACILYAQDVFTRAIPALAVCRPGSANELAAIVAACTAKDCAVIARGGGMSYTGGVVPQRPDTVILDSSRLDQILEINSDDMYVTVQPGCSWSKLQAALTEHDLRTPYWGPLSGRFATVGGGASQNAIFWGSGQYGSAADSVIGLQVVQADGQIIDTGAAARPDVPPFFRHFGPDLTGLFLCDSGALGIKVAITLRLMRPLPSRAFLSFDFPEEAALIRAISEVSRQGLAMETFGFDPNLQRQRLKRESLLADLKSLGGVVKQEKSLVAAVKEGARVAVAGRRYMKDVAYSVHYMVEQVNEEAARTCEEGIRSICQQEGGREIENSIPKITRANPFGPVNNMIGPEGERWLPVHGLFPHSLAVAAAEAMAALFRKNAESMERYGILPGYLYTSISTNALVIEPVFFWPDELNEFHREYVDDDVLARIDGFAANSACREEVERLRNELIEIMDAHGATHLQLAKAYNYASVLPEPTRELLLSIKRQLDPKGLLNPGALQL